MEIAKGMEFRKETERSCRWRESFLGFRDFANSATRIVPHNATELRQQDHRLTRLTRLPRSANVRRTRGRLASCVASFRNFWRLSSSDPSFCGGILERETVTSFFSRRMLALSNFVISTPSVDVSGHRVQGICGILPMDFLHYSC